MTELDIKIGLQNYSMLKNKIKQVKEKIEYIESKQFKVGGSIVKIPENPTNNEQYKLGLIEKKFQYKKDLEMYNYYIDIVDSFLNALQEPLKSLIKDKFINHKSITLLERKYSYSSRQIYRIIDKSILKYIELT